MLRAWVFVVLAAVLRETASLYSSGSGIIELTEKNWEQQIGKSDGVWLVEFYAPWCGHCQSLVPEYKKAAAALSGVVKVAAVNADEERSLAARFKIKGFPTIKVFPNGGQGDPEEYSGGRTADGITSAMISTITKRIKKQSPGGFKDDKKSSSSDAVIELTDSNFDKLVLGSDDIWLVEFFAPWCGHCKSLAPHWAKAAEELKGKVKLGALDATAHGAKAQEYGVQGYPTIKYFGPGSKDRSSAEDYQGGRTAGDIVNFALEKLAENVPSPEVNQIVTEEDLKKACDQPLCVISVLPHILDCQADCRNGYLDILKAMGEKYKKKMWGWVWSEAGTQPEVESALEIGGFGYPAMAVLNAKKMKYSILRGSFSKDGINEFLRDLSYGRGNTSPVKGAALPSVEKTEPWDGKDGVAPQDDDIDLSDVELDDIPKEEL